MPGSSPDSLIVAVVGATGAVGRTMTQVLLEKAFPMTELRLLASERSAGRRVTVGGREIEVGLATPEAFEGVDIALFSAGGGTSKELAPEAAKRGAAVIDNSRAWRMDPAVPLVVSQVNPDDLAWHEGIIANPNCSTMQLMPPLMALRDAVGIERVVVDTYQSVAGTGHKAIVELEEQVKAHAEGRPKVASVYPHPIAFNALPHIDVFLDNGYTKEEWKVVTESRKILHLPDLRVSCTAVRVPVFISHSEAVHVETRDPITPGRGAGAVRRRQGRRRPGRSGGQRVPAGDRGRRLGRRVRRPGPPGPVDRGQPRPRVLGRVGQPAQGRGVQRGGDRRGRWSSAAGSAASRRSTASAGAPGAAGGSRSGRPGDGPRDARRAPGGARGDRERGPGLHPLPAARRPDEGRAGRGRPRHRGRVRRRGPGLQRGPRGPAVRRPRRRPARPAARLHRLAARRRVHHQRRQVPPARQPRPPAGRDRGLRAVPAPPARGARPGRRRDPRPVLDGDVHARRPDRPGPRHDRARSIPETGAGRRARVRDVPPGRGAAHAGDRARELRGHRARARTC